MIHNSKFNRLGFTLIEVLIVVAIIGILASVVLVGLGPLQKQGRDTRRISDLRQVQAGLELYYNKCGYYPGAEQAGQTCGTYTGITAAWDAQGGLREVLIDSGLGIANVPNDPNANRDYLYWSDGATYVLGAALDDPNNPALQQDVDGTNVQGLTVTCGDAIVAQTNPNAMYCVQL